MRISIIVPCYNEQAVLKLFYVEIVKVLEKITIMNCYLLMMALRIVHYQLLKPFVLIIHILNILLFQEILEKKLRCMRGFVMWMRTM